MYRNKEIFYRVHSGSFGDTLASTPTLRRLYFAYGEKINIVTKSFNVFKGNPYVKNIFSFEEYESLVIENSDWEVFDSFTYSGKKDERGIEKKYSTIDTRQLHSMDLGFQLLPEQMSYDYYPLEPSKEFQDDYLDNLKNKEYVVLHVTSNWANRTWTYSEWEAIVKWLAGRGILTVTIGMDYKEPVHHSLGKDPIIKTCPKFNSQFGYDLTNKGTLDEMWHIINGASCIITSDSGPLHLAGTTDTRIIQLGSAIDWRFRAPYRKGTQKYKYEHIGGSCQLFCNSNLFYNVQGWGTINAIPPMMDCKEKKEAFECHPTSQKVINVLSRFLDEFEKEKNII